MQLSRGWTSKKKKMWKDVILTWGLAAEPETGLVVCNSSVKMSWNKRKYINYDP